LNQRGKHLLQWLIIGLITGIVRNDGI
jgi:hypothetical protein